MWVVMSVVCHESGAVWRDARGATLPVAQGNFEFEVHGCDLVKTLTHADYDQQV